MNFLDTAITLLMESGRPMAVEELCELAITRGLLDKPGANPIRSMKTRMTVELKKGSDSRLQRNDDEIWEVCKGVDWPAGAPEPEKKAEPSKAAKAPNAATAKVAKKKPAKATKEPKAAKAPKVAKEPKAAKAPAAAKTAKATKASKARKPKIANGAGAATDALDAAASPVEVFTAADSSVELDSLDDADLASIEQEEPLSPPIELTPEEQALVELYSGDSQGTRSAAELNEYQDELTSDEDRLMLPEIRAERHRPRPQERDRERGRRRRRGRTDRPEKTDASLERPRDRDRERLRERDRERPRDRDNVSSSRPTLNGGPRDIAGTPIQVMDVQGDASASLTRSALKVLSVLPTGQTMPVRQLTQTLLREGHIEGQADQMWRMVKGVLLVSEQRRRTRGLHPLVRYHGKDLFSAGPDLGRSVVDMASAALGVAAENYAAAVEGEMLSRLSHLAPQMLERIAYVYLQETGWTDITWLKRVDRSSYALATAPGAVDETLVSVRSGPEDIDRRGVGELRAGLHAKDLSAGFLISPCELSEEADTELAREGAHIRVLCGRAWIAELCAREVAVTWRHIQLPQIDQRFLDAVLS